MKVYFKTFYKIILVTILCASCKKNNNENGIIDTKIKTHSFNDLLKLHDISNKVIQINQKDFSYNEDGSKELWFETIYKFNEFGNTSSLMQNWIINDLGTFLTTFKYDNQNRILKEETTQNNLKYSYIDYKYKQDSIFSIEMRSDTLYEKRTKVLDKIGNVVFEQKFLAPFGDYLHKSKFSYDKNNIKIKEIKHYAVINKNYATCCHEYIDTLNFVYDKNNFLISDGFRNPTLFKYSNLDKNNNWTTKKTYFYEENKIPTIEIERIIVYKK